MILASNNAHKLDEFRAIFADMGTHEELMAHSPIYRETYEQQTSGGEDDE